MLEELESDLWRLQVDYVVNRLQEKEVISKLKEKIKQLKEEEV